VSHFPGDPNPIRRVLLQHILKKMKGCPSLGPNLYYRFFIIAMLCLEIQINLKAGEVYDPYHLVGYNSEEHIHDPNVKIEEKDSFFDSLRSFDDWPKEKKVVALNTVTIGTIAAIGVAGWDYGSHSFRTANEGWFDPDTNYGGADKLGHVFTCYALASVYNRIYKDWGYSDNDAILLGAANSLLTMSVKVRDSVGRMRS
jgi:hypothetical protein